MSTHSSACLDRSPASKRLGPSAQMSAISASSPSESCVQSLVSTSIAISRIAPGSSQKVLLVQRVRADSATRPTPFQQVRSLSAYQCVGTQEYAELADEAVGGVDTELVGEAQHLFTEMHEDLGLARMLQQRAFEALDELVGEPSGGQLDAQRRSPVGDALEHVDLHGDQLGGVVSFVDPALHAHGDIVGQLVAVLGHRLGKDHDLATRLEVFEG